MNIEKGEVHFMSEVATGESNGRRWANMNLVIIVNTSASTFKYMVFRVSGDRVEDVCKFRKGDKVEVGYAVSAREYQGKWYANVDLVSIKADGQKAAAPAAAPAQATNGETDDFPF